MKEKNSEREWKIRKKISLIDDKERDWEREWEKEIDWMERAILRNNEWEK